MEAIDLLQAVIDSPTQHGIVVTDADNRIRLWNAGAARIFQYTEDEVMGRSIRFLFAPEDADRGVPDNELAEALRNGCATDCRWHVRKDGSLFWVDGLIYPVHGRAGEHLGYIEVLRDSTEEKETVEATARLALQDSLTGLSNRAEFHNRFAAMAASAHRHHQLLILMLIDLDYFKQINDDLGHAVGDAVLQQTAQRMRRLVRDTDALARMGGDEFAVILSDAGSAEAGGTAADKIIKALSHPFQIGERCVRVGASVGISVYPQDALELDTLFRKADQALYRAKAEGRGLYRFHTAQMDAIAHRHNLEQVQMRRAVKQRAFWISYQPQVDAAGNVTAVEALLRCSSEFFAGYATDRLVALAAETGRLRRLGPWARTEASRQLRRWQLHGWPDLRLIMNLCRIELAEPRFAQGLMALLTKAELSPTHLEIDIAEPNLADGMDSIPIMELHDQGVSLAIDDVGTGGMSLKHLFELPIDTVKLDLGTMATLTETPRGRAIALAVCNLCRALDIRVVAERVETQAQADFMGPLCDAMQGYHIACPMTADDMTAWLKTRRSAALGPVSQFSHESEACGVHATQHDAGAVGGR